MGFRTSQVSGFVDNLRNDLQRVEWDVRPYSICLSEYRTMSQFSMCTAGQFAPLTTRWDIITGTPVTFSCNSGNYCLNFMILQRCGQKLSACIQAHTKICHHTLILLLHYLAKANRSARNY